MPPTLLINTPTTLTAPSVEQEQGATVDTIKHHIEATEHMLEATALTQPTPTPFVWTPEPISTPTLSTGLRSSTDCIGSYPHRLDTFNCWLGIMNNQYVKVDAGNDPQDKEQGLITVITTTLDQARWYTPLFYPTPVKAGGVMIAAINDSHIVLIAPNTVFVFDVLSRTWLESGPCQLYPIAIPASTLNTTQNNTALHQITHGMQANQFGWLSWTGENKSDMLANSLTPPGNSENYINPDNATDRSVSVGDWVISEPGDHMSADVRRALDQLITSNIIILVPIWDQIQRQGNTLRYHISTFAWVHIVDYGSDSLSFTFIAPAHCTP